MKTTRESVLVYLCLALTALANVVIADSARTAKSTAIVVNGFVVGITVNDSGFGYTVPPSIDFVGGGGKGAVVVAEIMNESVTKISVVATGSGYSSTPDVVIEPPIFDLNDTLVGYWPFESDLEDASDYKQEGTLVGSASYVNGAVGRALAISGASYVEIGDPSDGRYDIGLNQDFTISIWVKTTMSSGLWYPMLLTKDTGYNSVGIRWGLASLFRRK